MNRKRIWALATLVVLVFVSGVAYGVAEVTTDDEAAAPATTTTTEHRTTTTEKPTTTTEPPVTTTTAPPIVVPVAGTVVEPGSSGPEVQKLQERLAALKLDPGPIDGEFGTGTTYAVWAFQKSQGLPVDGIVGDAVWAALANPAPLSPLVPDGGGKRVEIDKGRQLLFVYEGDDLRLMTHISTGNGKRYCEEGACGVARTPSGTYAFTWRFSGWRTSRLGKLYNPVYFNGGIAVHGATSVPTYPASHGCVRIPMHIAEYFPTLVAKGDPVYVLDGDGSPVPAGGSAQPSEPAPATTAPPETTTSTEAPPPEETTTTTTSTPTTAPPPPEETTTTTTQPPPPGTTPTTPTTLEPG